MFNVKKTILNLTALFVLCAPGANAQTPPFGQQPVLLNGSTVYLTKTPMAWQNDEWNMETNIAKDAEGNIYIAGTFYGGSDTELYVKKVNPLTGAEIWTSTIASPGYDYGRGAAVDGAGNLYVLAMMDNKIVVARLAADSGTPTWGSPVIYDSGFGNSAYDIVADGSGAYVAGATGSKIAIIKFPADGVSAINAVNFGGGANYSYSAAYGIAFSTGSSGSQLIVAGAMDEGNDYGNEIWLGKFNKADLSHVWASTYTPANHQYWGCDEAHAVKTDAAGNIYVAGFYQSQDSGQDIWLGKYDPSGNLIYAKTKNGPSNGYDKGFGLALDPQGNVYVTGKLEAYSLNQQDNLWLGKYSPSGSLSEVAAHLGSELGFDVEVSSWMVSVGGGFQEQYGLLTVSPEQFGEPQQLFAGPGQYTGSVNLSWVFETAGTFDYKIQYSTYDGVAFSTANAQVVSTGAVAAAGDTRNHAVMGLPTIVNNLAGGVAGPVYYFNVWTSADGGATWTALTNVGKTAPNAPYNYWKDNTRGQDRFWVFNNSYSRASAIARDASGNIYAAYGSDMGGLGITRFNQYGMAEWTSFYNHSAFNGRFTVSRLKLDISGNIYAAGAVESNYSGSTDAWIARFNPLGVKIWDEVVQGAASESDAFSAIAFDGAGKVYAGGEIAVGASDDDAMLLVKYEPMPMAAQQWISSYTYKGASPSGAPASIRGLAVAADNIYAGGYFSSVISGTAYDRNAAIVKFNMGLKVL
ncbi:MAG: hypothetical protein KKH28_06220, partial [Elusimicrobia bacterium]|nr:hypothetical protein [Elusimicrobiota bacterium]